MRLIASSPTKWKVPLAFFEIIRSTWAPISEARDGAVTLFTSSPPNTVNVRLAFSSATSADAKYPKPTS